MYWSTTNSWLQLSPCPPNVSVYVFPSDPVSVNVTLVGLVPSWFDASFHTFVAVTVVVFGVYLFVIVNVSWSVLSRLYPSTVIFPSLTVNVTVCPSIVYLVTYTVFVHVLVSPSWGVTSNVYALPSEPVNVKLTLVGLTPSWFDASFHTFLTVIGIVSIFTILITLLVNAYLIKFESDVTLISFNVPSSFTNSFWTMYFHSLSSFNSTFVPSILTVIFDVPSGTVVNETTKSVVPLYVVAYVAVLFIAFVIAVSST